MMNGPTSTLLAALNLSEEDKARVLAQLVAYIEEVRAARSTPSPTTQE